MFSGFISGIHAMTVTNSPSYTANQCTEFRDGNRVFEDKYIYLHSSGAYSSDMVTVPSNNYFFNDLFYNYGQEFVIRGKISNVNIDNKLASKVILPNTASDWKMTTNYTPKLDDRYYVFSATKSLQVNRATLVPQDAQTPAFQIAYTLGRAKVGGSRSLGPVLWQSD